MRPVKFGYTPMKILLCDDQAVIRDGLEMLLHLEKDIQVIATAQDGAEAVELAAQKQPIRRHRMW